MKLSTILRETWCGKDIYRILMNSACEGCAIGGKTVDVGSSTTLASYHRFLKRGENVSVECVDLGFETGNGQGKRIDLETDSLPYGNETVDTVLMFNLLEHIYNYGRVVGEAKRVLKLGGSLIGAVPFLVNYHPDPHDYWRYTHETLRKIFSDELYFAAVRITPFGYGPFTAAWSHMEQVFPRILKVFMLPLVLACDWLVLKLRPKMNKERFVLGYFFSVKK